MDTAVTLPFADGEYRFWLPLPQIIELERKTGDTSILTLEERMRAAIGVDGESYVFAGGGSAMIGDVRETIRLGLIGGNAGEVDGAEIEVGPMLAKSLVNNYVAPARPFGESVVVAWQILHAAIYGIRLKKKRDDGRRHRNQPFRKGQLIANSGSMGLDWRTLDLSGYLEALEAHNEAHSPESKDAKDSDPDWLAKMMAVRVGRGG